MIALDIMHVFHLGVGRDVVGAAIKVLCSKRIYYGGRTISIRLGQLMAECKAFAARHGKYLTFSRLKKSNLQWRQDKCPELRGSAADTAVFLAFLSEKLQNVDVQEPYQGLTACLWTANTFAAHLSNGNFFLEEHEREFLFVVGRAFLASWAQLCYVGFSRSELLFKMRPKFHILVHIIEDLSIRQSGRNPCVDSCWLEEDFVKWALRKYRKVSRRTASHNVLRRSLVQQKDRLQRWREAR